MASASGKRPKDAPSARKTTKRKPDLNGVCPTCEGGRMARYAQLCRTCGGSRRKDCKTCSATGWATYSEICRTCGGSGSYGREQFKRRSPAAIAPTQKIEALPVGAQIAFAFAGAQAGLEKSQARRARRQKVA